MKKTSDIRIIDTTGAHIVRVSHVMADALSQSTEFVAKAQQIGALTDQKEPGSQKLTDIYGVTLDGADCAIKPFDFFIYAFATSLNTYHARCGQTKAKDVVGRPWNIVGEGTESVKKEITDFFVNSFGEKTFGEGMQLVWKDYEWLGNGYLEVIPTADGKRPARFEHIPSTEMWIRLDGLGYLQQKNGRFSHFLGFGVQPEDLAAAAISESSGIRKATTSIVHFSNYFPWSLYYGIPCIMPAWNRMALAVLETEYNLGFFSNNAIPDYAVVLEGDWGEDAEQTIQQYFRTHLKGQSHKTMVLRTAQGAKATFEKLTSDNAKEGGFRLLRIDCRDEVLHAHGVPPIKVGLTETGKLGGNQASEQIVEYKNGVVTPGQEKVEARLNRIIEWGWPGSGFAFKFEPYDTDDLIANSQVDGAYLDRDVITPNEVRAIRFPSFDPLEEGDLPLSATRQAAPMGELQKVIRQAVTGGETR